MFCGYNQAMSYKLLIDLSIIVMFAKGLEKFHWKTHWTALFCVITPFAINSLTNLISNKGVDRLFLLNNIPTIIFQYVIALIVFNFLALYEDTIVLWFVWLIGGGLVIFVLVPAIVQSLVF